MKNKSTEIPYQTPLSRNCLTELEGHLQSGMSTAILTLEQGVQYKQAEEAFIFPLNTVYSFHDKY